MFALLSNATIDSLAQSAAKLTGEEIYTSSGYNTWAQELLSASFGGSTPDCVFLILDGAQLMGDAFPTDWPSAKVFARHSSEEDTAVHISKDRA